MGFALLFPGQGSQSVGMGRALAEASAEAAGAWKQADEALGEPLSRLAWEGPAEQLDLTVNAQPALLAASIAAHRALRAAWTRAARRGELAAPASGPVAGAIPVLASGGAAGVMHDPASAVAAGGIPVPAFVAGHSMGQYSAMVAAGALDLADAIRLVRERGRLMQASSTDGAMAAIIGLDEARLPALMAAGSAAGVFTLANRNSPGQVVVSGERAAVEAAAESARSLGARRAVLLPVSVAAHSPLMAGAAEGMRRALASVVFRDPEAPLLANADARRLTTGEACRGELVEHLTAGVDWVAAVEHMAAAGVDTFIEVGPGRVLSGLVKRITPGATVIATDDPGAPGAIVIPFIDPQE